MAYTLSTNHKYHYVELSFDNPTDAEEHFKARDETINYCHNNNIRKLIVDTSRMQAQDFFSKENLVDFANTFEESKIRNLTTALILPEENQESQERYYFALNSMRLAGLTIQPFFDINKAREWLESSEAPMPKV